MKKLSLVILSLLIAIPSALAQDAAITMELMYTQKSDKVIDLKTTVVDEESTEPIAGLIISYTALVNGQSIALGESATDKTGVSALTLISLDPLRKLGHTFTITGTFAGNEKFQSNEVKAKVLDASLTILTEVVDSVPMVRVTLQTWNEKGEVIPVNEGEVKVYVPRMFSLLPVGDITTDEEGNGELKFASDIPGGTNGELTIIVRVEEDKNFNNIETFTDTSWGVPASVQASKLPRALWSPNAPTWMVVTFIVLMTGVWYHYALIIFELIRIRRAKHPDAIDYSE
jgi:hypothetical protein